MRSHRLTSKLFILASLTVAAPAEATFPGDNGKLVFQRPAGEDIDLFTIRPDGAGLKRVAGAPVIEEEPSWSPDGKRIAFARSAKDGYPTDVWTMRANGRGLERVTRWDDIASAPVWTADSRIVYFTTKDFPPPSSPEDPPPPSELYSMRADGADQRRLTHDDAIQVDPAVSVTGRVAFTEFKPVPDEPGVFDLAIFSCGPRGGDRRNLLPFSAKRDVFNPNFSPDGRRIVYEIASASPEGNTGGSRRQSDLAVMKSDGSGVRRLTRTGALETSPVWSPDGRFIAFTSDLHRRRGKRERFGRHFELYVMRADGSEIRRITHNSVPDLLPNWQPLPKGAR